MKTCPYCAEEIQDAAIVCKHCGRDQRTPASASSTSASSGRWIAALAFVLVVGFALIYFGEDHQRFLAFDRQRAAWHQRCDRYVGQAVAASDRGREDTCVRELNALMRTAHDRGWDK